MWKALLEIISSVLKDFGNKLASYFPSKEQKLRNEVEYLHKKEDELFRLAWTPDRAEQLRLIRIRLSLISQEFKNRT